MKTIVIDARLIYTSTGRYTERLLHYLQEVDTQHRYVVLLKPKDLERWQPTSPNFSKLACPYPEFGFGEQLGMLRQLQKLHADLVHFTMAQQPILYRGPVVTTLQDLTRVRFRNPAANWLVFTLKQPIYKFLIKYVAKKSRAIITPTNFVKQDVANYCHVSPDKCVVTYEAADTITAEVQPLKQLIGKQFLLYVGRPDGHKNLPRLVDAFRKLQLKHPELLLVFTGKFDRGYQQLKDYAQLSGDGVLFTDFVSEGELRWLYQQTAVYVFPSLSEGFGLPPLEAMQNGPAPVASSKATCLPEVNKDGALYFDPLDVADMAATISRILANKQLAMELAQKGQQLAKTYSWKRMAEQTLAIYKEVLGEA